MLSGRSHSVAAVTGGGGFVGLHLLRALTDLGWECHVFSRHDSPGERYHALSPRPRIIHCPTPESVGTSVASLGPDVVFHLGAVTSTRRTMEELHTTLRWNLLSTISLFEALLGTRVCRVVYLGSCEEYGRGDAPFCETSALDPISPYSASKAAASCYARMFCNSFGLPVTIIRPSVIYGPGQAPTMMIPEVIASLLRGQEVATTEGTQTRDFLFIADLVDALVRAGTVAGIEGEIFNVGSGTAVSVRTCIQLIEEITGRSDMVRYGAKPFSPAEIFAYAVDIRRAAQYLKWKPRTSLTEGLRVTIAAQEAALKAL